MTDYRMTFVVYIHALDRPEAARRADALLAVIKSRETDAAAWIEAIRDAPSLNSARDAAPETEDRDG